MGELLYVTGTQQSSLLCLCYSAILRSEILGALKMRSYLSGMPELKLGLNDRVLFEQAGRSVGKVRCKLLR